jgi:hypothetical protein
MNAHKPKRLKIPLYDDSFKGPFWGSVSMHVLLITVAIVGLPIFAKKYPMTENYIAVDMVEVAEITQTNKAPAPAKTKAEDKPKEQPKPSEPESKPKAPTVTEPEPPKPVEPAKPKADDIAPPDKKPEKKKEEDKKPAAPPKPKPEVPQPTEKVTETDESFDSLLKNLMKSDPQTAPTEVEGEGSAKAPDALFGEKMTMSEMDAVRYQLGQCWKLMAGARYAEDLVVEIKLTINQDRTVKDARIVDQLRYTTDGYFRAAADSAYRAVFEDACTPLNLPAEKYNLWKSMTVRFDPREML